MDGMNRVAMWYGGSDLRIEEVPLKPLQPNEVRIEVAACGVCGTDVHIIEDKFPIYKPPNVLGHEYTGTVVEVGAAVKSVEPGDRVTVDTSDTACGLCAYCRNGAYHLCPTRLVMPGAFAHYTQVLERTVHRLPDDVPFELGTLTEPLACALHAVDLAAIPSGAAVLIVGAGTIGLLLLQLVVHSGAALTIVSDPNPRRRELALRLGADHVVDPLQEDLREVAMGLTGGLGVERAFEAVGAPATFEAAVSCARRGARVVMVGVADPEAKATISPYHLYHHELTLVGSFIRKHTYPRALRWLSKLELEPLLTHRFPLDQTMEAIQATREGRGVKNLVVPRMEVAAP